MKRFQLKYISPQMEEEYVLLKQQTNVENIQMSFYFIIFLLMIPGIPAIIDAHYTDAIIAAATAVLLSFIYFWKGLARKWVQFLAGVIISSFDFCMLLMPTSSFDTSSKGLLFFRGYAFAGINVVLLSRFATQKQKLLFLIFCYAFRFTLIILLDPSSAQVYTIIRHIYIDLFALYVNFSHEKKERVVFKRFYEYREELTKFKELLADDLPQAITITKSFKEKPLFSNKSFQDLFGRSSVDMGLLSDSEAQTTLQTRNLLSPTCKFDIKYLQVNKNTLREAGIVPVQIKNTTDELVYLKDIGEDLIKGNLLDNKPLSLSAFQSTESENKSFDVVLKKVKWDGEDAVAVIFNDITYQENLIRLKISTMNKDKIIATLSHELRTPLNGIIGILEMVEKRGKDSEILEYIGLCKDNAYLLLSLVNSLLDLQQFRQGKLTLNPDRIKITRILRDVTRLFRFQCQRKNINLDFKINEGMPSYIITDEHRLKQILINLIANAIKFTSKGNVSIELWQEIDTADSIQISVKDTGIGIREEDKSKLFTMSERIDNGAIVNAHGVGLGLTVSNVLACILGGKTKDKAIEVCSKYNEGSQFTFSILKDLNKGPIEKEGLNVLNELETSLEKLDADEEYRIPLEYSQEDMDIKPSPASKVKKYVSSHLIGFPSGFLLGLRKGTSKLQFSPDGFSPLEQKENSPGTNKILKNVFSLDIDSSHPVTPRVTESEKGCLLVVDDNPFNLLVAENIIKDLGYTVQLAKSGSEAIDIVKAKNGKFESFKAILMDCQMPIMDGFETTRKLRELMERNEVANIPIIALTANNGQEDIRRCYESGMVNHLSKPLFANALLKALSGVNQRFTGPHFDSTTKI